jgi:hypothetical protein
MASTLEKAIARFRRRQLAARQLPPKPADARDPFRALVEQRLATLEQQLGELKGRVNGLIFLVAGTALSQIIMKLMQ